MKNYTKRNFQFVFLLRCLQHVIPIVLLCCATMLQAQVTRTVCASGCDFTTIAAAVAASADGDIVHVNTALHTEISVAITDKNLTIRGNGIASTTVQGNANRNTAAGRIFTITGTSVVIIEDMKIQHGNSGAGGAININGSGSFSANRVHFYRNNALEAFQNVEGGAIYCLSNPGHSLSFIQCTFEENTCGTAQLVSRGGAIYSAASAGALTGTVSKCTFLNNSVVNTGGALNAGFGAIAWTVSDCTFEGNSVSSSTGNGGAMNANTAFLGGISGCLFKNNSAGLAGGALRFGSSGTNPLVVTNCTFFNNTAVDGARLWRQTSTGSTATHIVNCSLVKIRLVAMAAEYTSILLQVRLSKSSTPYLTILPKISMWVRQTGLSQVLPKITGIVVRVLPLRLFWLSIIIQATVRLV